MVVFGAGLELSPLAFLERMLAGIPTAKDTTIEIMEYDQMETVPAGAKYLIATITAEAAIKARVAPKAFAHFVNAPRINVPIRMPNTKPINPLNHS